MHQAAPSSSAVSEHRPHLDRRSWSDWCDEKGTPTMNDNMLTQVLAHAFTPYI